jgi:hypothetical protein
MRKPSGLPTEVAGLVAVSWSVIGHVFAVVPLAARDCY